MRFSSCRANHAWNTDRGIDSGNSGVTLQGIFARVSHFGASPSCPPWTTTLDLERNFLDLAMTQTGPCLIVCDRGAMDGKAYCGEETWNRARLRCIVVEGNNLSAKHWLFCSIVQQCLPFKVLLCFV